MASKPKMKPSDTSSKNSDRLKKIAWSLLNQALNYYPNQKLSPENIEAYLVQWQKLIEETSVSRFQDGLEDCYRNCSFFPSVADISGRIPEAIPEAERQAGDHLTYASPTCPICNGEGWVTVHGGRTIGFNVSDKHLGAAARCECYKNNKATGKTYVARPGFHPTEADLAFRGSEEQKQLWRNLKAEIARLCNTKAMHNAPRKPRPILPSCEELAQELEQTRELREKLK